MGLSRRELLLGAGSLTVGAGIIGGSGAFDTVEAERDVRIEFEGDAGAILGMGPVEGQSREFVSVTEDDDGVVGISIDRVNRNARTVIDEVLAFTNNGTRPILRMTATVEDLSDNAALLVHDDLDGVSIDVGETVVGLGFTIDTLNDNGHTGEPNVGGIVRIGAYTEE
ncbi:MAG: hypothetical protein ACOCQ3_00465 [Natronomonas sp.]